MNDLLKQLQALIPLAAGATQGPWTSDKGAMVSAPAALIAAFYTNTQLDGKQNAAFIAAARNLLTPKNLAALCAALASQWVSVTDRLPEEAHTKCGYSGRVLAFGDGGIDGPHFVAYCSLPRLSNGAWYLAHDHQPSLPVSHWMPLPTPPAPMEGAQPRA